MALVGAAIAVAFLVLALLFDEMSFPHVPYIFLYMVGLAAVVAARRERRSETSDDAGRPAVVAIGAAPGGLVRPRGAQDPPAPLR